MGILTKAKLKSLNPILVEKWLPYNHDHFKIDAGKLVLRPVSHKRILKPLIFIKRER